MVWARQDTRHADFLGTRVFGSLDGLRALSVIAVIWYHTEGSAEGFTQGSLGVDFFFAISGFLITTLLLREQSTTGRISLRNFYIRRTLRIVPLYLAVLGLYTVLVLTTRAATPEGRTFMANLPAYATYTSNWFVDRHSGPSVIFYFAWSLATEEQFYLVWPVALAFAARRRRGLAVVTGALLVAAALGVSFHLAHPERGTLPIEIVKSIATPICAGALLGLVLHTRTGFTRLGGVLGHRATAPALVAVVGVVVAAGVSRDIIGTAMALLVAAMCVREDHLLARVLACRPLAYLGRISYGMYLLHMLCANLVRVPLHRTSGLAVFGGTLALVILAASASHRWFEAPFLALKHRLQIGRPSAAPPPADRAEAS
ncbi:MAG TPA: acyltransferase [Pseudonocardia sp.]|nr:acyltransferase [Pseudonocardia sp.]